jgi:hypothetical protein
MHLRYLTALICTLAAACSSSPAAPTDTDDDPATEDGGRRPVANDPDSDGDGDGDGDEDGDGTSTDVIADTSNDTDVIADTSNDSDVVADTSNDSAGTDDVVTDSGLPEDDAGAEADSATDPDADTLSDTGAPTDADVFVCEAVSATATPANRPADILWVVDNSLSMQEEVVLVSEGINAFVNFIEREGINARVVMISYDNPVVGDGWYHVCVPPPLSGTGPGVCPTGRDVDSARYLHVREIVDSREPLSKLIDEYASYSSFLRADAVTHIIAVTDDNADIDAATFRSQLSALRPGFAGSPIVHSLVTQASSEIRNPFDDSCTRPGCPCGFAVGSVYQELASLTGGTTSSICDEDWSGIFEAIAASVVLTSAVPCSYPIPDPPGSLTVNPAQINVAATPAGGARTVVPNVEGASDCSGMAGWYFDNPALPTRVQLCPASCEEVTGTVDIEYGCDTVKR